MRTNQKNKFPYSPFKTFCVRTPTLPLEFYLKLVSKSKISDGELQEHFENPVISEAVYLASPELFEQLSKWFEGHITDEKKVRRLRSTLLKYLTRMSTRCTPFGLFAVVGTGLLDKETIIEPKPYSEFHKKAQYDMQYLAALANYFANKPNIKKQLLFFPNSSLYKMGQRYRYVEYTYEKKQRAYTLESVSHSSYLEDVLDQAKKGTTLDSLIKLLENQEIETEEAISFVNQLVENQILVSELEPTVTGDDFLLVIREKISTLANVDIEVKQINEFIALLKKLNQGLGIPIELYESLNKNIAELDIPFEKKNLIQVDTYNKFYKNTLSYSKVKSVKECIAFLNKIFVHQPMQSLEKFKLDFNKRYEHQKVPLLQLLDVETGVGYGQSPTNLSATPYLDDIVYIKRSSNLHHKTPKSSLFQVLQSKLAIALSEKKHSIELKDSDFPNNEYYWEITPNTVSVMVELVSDKGQDMLFLNHCSEHAGRLFGRFGNGSEHLSKLLNEISDIEANMNPDYILAEIVHLPESRTGNILRRPVLSEFEIPYLCKSNLNHEKQIPLNDLLVGVENGLVVIYSKRLGKPILPKLSNAHNYTGLGLPTYHFLCDIQYQQQRGFGFDWPDILKSNQYLPRVTYKNCILRKARWNLKKKHIKPLLEYKYNTELLLTKTLEWRKEFSIPEMVEVVDGDNTLVVNFKNYNCICMFLDTVKNSLYFTLEEFLWLRKKGSRLTGQDFCAQYVLSFYDYVKLNETAHD